MKLSTNHPHEKNAWLDAFQPPGQSSRIRQHSEKGSVTSSSPWVERNPGSLSERTYSKSSPPRSDSIGSPPNSATPKGSISTSGVHSQVTINDTLSSFKNIWSKWVLKNSSQVALKVGGPPSPMEVQVFQRDFEGRDSEFPFPAFFSLLQFMLLFFKCSTLF